MNIFYIKTFNILFKKPQPPSLIFPTNSISQIMHLPLLSNFTAPLSSGRGTVSQKSIPLSRLIGNIPQGQKRKKNEDRMEKKKIKIK